MDKALFRGKRTDNNEWVEGFYFQGFTGICYVLVLYDHILGMTEYYEVDPETVGQWSGETDINNKKIFEGDIVKYTHDWEVQGEYDVIAVVDFCCGGFEPMSLANGGAFYSCGDRKYEVLGNIHDNPELLGEQEG